MLTSSDKIFLEKEYFSPTTGMTNSSIDCCWSCGWEIDSVSLLKELISCSSTFITLSTILLAFSLTDSNTSPTLDLKDSLSFSVGDLTIIVTFSDCNGATIKGFLSSLKFSLFLFFSSRKTLSLLSVSVFVNSILK